MTGRTSPPASKGARPAARARWRLAARLLSLLAILVLAATSFEAHACPSHLTGVQAALEMPDAGPGEQGCTVHHCAQCGCHQAVTAETEAASPVPGDQSGFSVTTLSGPARPQSPPRKPPRA
ncbi:hypothetical protein [Methylobacterium trifolii]|uniref:DUF2946 domain-containing protein n=1 Tax=Methylobacterium trifolii TaxID=1003092 RepID=A0ABQ4TTN3_9HYPH|nr:hypothetical protein [Methylobacterium trifolii]GJE58112.1 hypothetical protein MPOCJGCO_0190 [Methylobacterium trifolii]